jgi:hypothetical protein
VPGVVVFVPLVPEAENPEGPDTLQESVVVDDQVMVATPVLSLIDPEIESVGGGTSWMV